MSLYSLTAEHWIRSLVKFTGSLGVAFVFPT
jgi:hypothetical protein